VTRPRARKALHDVGPTSPPPLSPMPSSRSCSSCPGRSCLSPPGTPCTTIVGGPSGATSQPSLRSHGPTSTSSSYWSRDRSTSAGNRSLLRRAARPRDGPRLLVEDALVRRVLLHDHEPAAHRRQDVHAVELPQLRLARRRLRRRTRRRGRAPGRFRGGGVRRQPRGRGARPWLEPEPGLALRSLAHAIRPERLRGAAAHHGEWRLKRCERFRAGRSHQREHGVLGREAHLALVDARSRRGGRPAP
jgi:hypothetical protein